MKKYRSESYIDPEAALHLFTVEATGCGEELHTHDFIELVYILSGSAQQYVGEESYAVTRGDLLLIPEGETHAFAPTSAFSYVNICFDPNRLLRSGESTRAVTDLFGRLAFHDILARNGGRLVRFSEGERAAEEALLHVMLREYADKRHGWREMLSHYLDIFFLSVLRALEERGTLSGVKDMWEELAAYIDTHLLSDLSLPTLSRRLFYNPSYFSRAFSNRFGCPLTEYVAARRAQLAARIMSEAAGRMTVAKLAEAAGFSSKSAMYRAFSRHQGESFGAFLERCKKTNQ